MDDYFKLKPEYLLEPNIYLGSEIRKIDMHNGVWTWGFSSACYVHDSVKNVEKYLMAILGENPFSIRYLLDIDESPVLEPFLESYYQYHTGIMRWMVELGRININNEVSLLASQLVLPREVHLSAVFHIVVYLR